MIKKIAVNAILVIATFLACLLLLELTLRTGLLDDKDNPHPIWIPDKFQKIHEKIEEENWEQAKSNPFKFTDRLRSAKKNEGMKRIAVLGDSFVWGTGLPYESTWNHKLEKMINEKHQNFEVLHWGFPAWSTMDELSFLENHGLKYDIDMLIVGYVNNDPNVQRIDLKVFSWHKSAPAKVLKIFFPNAVSFIRAYLYNFLFAHYKTYGYSNWVDNLHSEDNLKEYAKLLQDFSQFCNSKKLKLLFVLTPSNYDEIYREQFDKIIPLLEQAHIKYLDLYPAAAEELGHINTRKLWANPGDPHPGESLTDLFASRVLDYLEKDGAFSLTRPDILSSSDSTNDGSGIEQDLVNIALTHNELDVRRKAVKALVLLNGPDTTELVMSALSRGDPEVREAAAYVLGEINTVSAVESLLKALGDEDPLVRKSAVLALVNKNDPRIIEALIRVATQDNDKYVRRRAILSLIKFKDSEITETLVRTLQDDFFYNRKTAIIALGKLKDHRVVGPLVGALYDEVKEVRLAAAEALGEIKDRNAVDTLKSVSLKDSDPLVRDFAAAAIKKITGEEYGKYRRKLLRIWGAL